MPRLKRSRRAAYVPEERQLAELAWLMDGNSGPVDPRWEAEREAAREAAWNRLTPAQNASYGNPDPALLAQAEADNERRTAAILAGEDVKP